MDIHCTTGKKGPGKNLMIVNWEKGGGGGVGMTKFPSFLMTSQSNSCESNC